MIIRLLYFFILSFPVFALAAEEAKEPSWWEEVTGIIAIPAAIIGLIYGVILIKKESLEIRKNQREIQEKEATTNGEPKPIPVLSASAGSSNSPKTLEDLYVEACEEDELFVEFCRDVINHGDFLKSTGNMLSKGVIEEKSLNRILMNLSNVFHKDHLIHLFLLGCDLYDQIPI